MRPSAVRSRILAEHEEIRALLARLEQALVRLRAGSPDAIAQARAARDVLCERLFAHVDLEDAILAPALRDADAWGVERERELLAHHRAQRAELDALERMEALDSASLCEKLERFVVDVREDMRHEERALLDPTLLRDDVIGIDASGG